MSMLRSLCQSCSFKRDVYGRRGQHYLLCRNDAIEAKYPPQPVLACSGYRPAPRNSPPIDPVDAR
jgi:hypothetical protein